ncbi:hypothetical protein K435DRAFT_872304 [Dendrothele bispora CBS 962.96]|uniref:Uncharacterized protein n=1 Tax=Dendrothele bispora (strain CBS 962.96) TaxID=1314807 RepID=A0A4S8L1V0_DENBC|nr:hypothetical protein K435DRAFT_872304 [Dendrothele bispora CBS 962.96]
MSKGHTQKKRTRNEYETDEEQTHGWPRTRKERRRTKSGQRRKESDALASSNTRGIETPNPLNSNHILSLLSARNHQRYRHIEGHTQKNEHETKRNAMNWARPGTPIEKKSK